MLYYYYTYLIFLFCFLLIFATVCFRMDYLYKRTDAESICLQVVPGDVIVTATDGLYVLLLLTIHLSFFFLQFLCMLINFCVILDRFDNLYVEELVSILTKMSSENASNDYNFIHNLASEIANNARTSAESTIKESPFSLAAHEAGYYYIGGKMDDITVVASVVCNGNADK